MQFLIPLVVTNHISVQVAAESSLYSMQFLRRLMRNGKLDDRKTGLVWLIDKPALESYLEKAAQVTDRRFGFNRSAHFGLQSSDLRESKYFEERETQLVEQAALINLESAIRLISGRHCE